MTVIVLASYTYNVILRAVYVVQVDSCRGKCDKQRATLLRICTSTYVYCKYIMLLQV